MVVSCSLKEWNKCLATEQAMLKARQKVRTVLMTEVEAANPTTTVRVKRDGVGDSCCGTCVRTDEL